ncbi:MAG: SDR family oxidoreductase [Planctomycetota bacterium]
MQRTPTNSSTRLSILARDAAPGDGAILLTGATGFLGAELLRRLIEWDHRPILALVRAASDEAAAERGHTTLTRVLDRAPTAAEATRVQWIRADLEQPRLGVAPANYDQLAEDVEEIFHCAASTRFDLPPDDAERTNVLGLRELIDLARRANGHHRVRRLHHVSTAYASGSCRGHVAASHLPKDRPHRFRNTYEWSKAKAERLLRAQTDMPFTIYRPSIIVGDSETGRTLNWNVVYPTLRLLAAGMLPFFPTDEQAPLDCVPVDFVADGIVALGRRSDTTGGTYHLTAGGETLTVREFLQMTYGALDRCGKPTDGPRPRLLGPMSWWAVKHVGGRFGKSRTRRAIKKLPVYAPYGQVRCRFDARGEHALLAQEGVQIAPRDHFFPKIVEYALRHGFGSRSALRVA